ncbi:alpha-hydroxy acid oxidase [Rhodococcoides kyotonense]|uniref:alpha-hydroxy acid oxidase n=1 Tax=Rhodococcoides kyotonense TaxID=398843 RepID=UPI001FEAF1DD|nr:alpha-hydroxy acid oxidase [Rhodococcus kyotonensis]
MTIEDLRQVSRRTTPRAVFDYVDGAADCEVTVAENASAFRRATFVPELLGSVADADPSVDLLGEHLDFPLVLAPTGFTRMMQQEGESAVARVAQRNRIPYALSTLGTTDIEDLYRAAPQGNNWFQLYFTNDPAINGNLLERALAQGCTTLIVTLDCAVGGRRLKDVRNGLTIPPSLTVRTFFDMARYPGWCFDKLTTPPIEFASVRNFPGTNAEVAAKLFDPSFDSDDLAWLRRAWPHTLLVKGVLSGAEARKIVDLGADGVIVSNHGGRQLDRTPATLDVLPEIRAAVGPNVTVLLDGGVLHGQDIAAAVAHGADAVMVGRAYLYGLMAGGERGVQRAVEILREQYLRTLQLVGVRSTAELTPSHVRLNPTHSTY